MSELRETLDALKERVDDKEDARDAVVSTNSRSVGDVPIKTAYSKNITIEEWNQLVEDTKALLENATADRSLATELASAAGILADSIYDTACLPLAGGTVDGNVDFMSDVALYGPVSILGGGFVSSPMEFSDSVLFNGGVTFGSNATTRASVVALIGNASAALSGLMSASDKSHLDTLTALLSDDDSDNVVDTIQEVLNIFNSYPEGASIATALAEKVTLATAQTITGRKIFSTGGGDVPNADFQDNYTDFWKTATFKAAVNVDGMIFTGGHEIRFPTYVEFKDNTAQHNAIVHVNQDYVNFWRQATFLSNLKISAANDANPPIMQTNFDREGGWAVFGRGVTFNATAEYNGLIWVGGREIRFPDYVEFKDNTDAHNAIVKIDQNFVDFNRTATFKQNLNVDGTLTLGGKQVNFENHINFRDTQSMYNSLLKLSGEGTELGSRLYAEGYCYKARGAIPTYELLTLSRSTSVVYIGNTSNNTVIRGRSDHPRYQKDGGATTTFALLSDIPDVSTKADLVNGKVPASQLPTMLPDISAGDAGKALVVNSTEDGVEWDSIGGSGAAELAESILYADLKALRDAGTLVPGKWYRITDYEATVAANSNSSNSVISHPYDILIRADAENVLNENCFAAQRSGDTYFDPDPVEAWKLCYCIDNDATRFDWADATNGKGVVYRLIDSWNNDVPFDFKSIVYRRGTSQPYYFLFSLATNPAQDLTIVRSICRNNHIGPSYANAYSNGIQTLPRTQFLSNGNQNIRDNVFSSLNSCRIQNGTVAENIVIKGLYSVDIYGAFQNNFIPGSLASCRYSGAFTYNKVLGDVYNTTFAGLFSYNTVLGYIKNSQFGTDCTDNVLHNLENFYVGNSFKNNRVFNAKYVYLRLSGVSTTIYLDYVQSSIIENCIYTQIYSASNGTSNYDCIRVRAQEAIGASGNNPKIYTVGPSTNYTYALGGDDNVQFQLTSQTDVLISDSKATYNRNGSSITVKFSALAQSSSSASNVVCEIGRFKGLPAGLFGNIPYITAASQNVVDAKTQKAYASGSGFGYNGASIDFVLVKETTFANSNDLVLYMNRSSLPDLIDYYVSYEATLLISPDITAAAS